MYNRKKNLILKKYKFKLGNMIKKTINYQFNCYLKMSKIYLPRNSKSLK